MNYLNFCFLSASESTPDHVRHYKKGWREMQRVIMSSDTEPEENLPSIALKKKTFPKGKAPNNRSEKSLNAIWVVHRIIKIQQVQKKKLALHQFKSDRRWCLVRLQLKNKYNKATLNAATCS